MITNLDKNHYLFGNKGAVWSETTHISKNGDSRTLCGTPMLSTNHSALQGVKEPGCPKCILLHKNNTQKEKTILD